MRAITNHLGSVNAISPCRRLQLNMNKRHSLILSGKRLAKNDKFLEIILKRIGTVIKMEGEFKKGVVLSLTEQMDY